MLNPRGFALFGANYTDYGAAWHPEPHYRGTYGILSSCLTTMILCIWTAVHLNMPEQHGFLRQVFRKTGWLIIGLFAPELVAWSAFQQNRDARQLTREMGPRLYLFCDGTRPAVSSNVLARCFRRIFRRKHTHGEDRANREGSIFRETLSDHSIPLEALLETNKSSSANNRPKRYYEWTTVHSYYALMGGFALDTNGVAKNMFPGIPGRLILTAAGLRFLGDTRPDLIPDLSKEHIKDKSNASGLAKTLVCIQATWFCIQCIARPAWGLSISLLELNTFAHALCALLIYLLWWHKPLDVEEPTIIQEKTCPKSVPC